ncbi:MAG: L-seryl-tRNA(Sec) selenium transferase [Terracidiphilus sp.]
MTAKADQKISSLEDLYRELPSVSDLLLTEAVLLLLNSHPRNRVVRACRVALENIRKEIAGGAREIVSERIRTLSQSIEAELSQGPRYSLRPVINATGVLLHTNLGRAPLSRKALEHVVEVAREYSNLELDLEHGQRGKRDVHLETLLLSLLQTTADRGDTGETNRAIIVNNCAAATFLALHALAKGKEVLVSRGELVEIGGGFRIPEILQESGALLKEVGTTNRTRIADYERAVSPNAALLLRVHQSNFSMEGFVERPSLEELVALGRRMNLPVFEDQGTGLVESLEPYGICGEPTLADSIGAGCDLVAASGDKLFGGPQCGILVGQKKLVDTIRNSPLFRTYRADKLNYAALEATLHQYLAEASDEIPVLRMLAIPEQALAMRCTQMSSAIRNDALTSEVVAVESLLGGGTTPKARVRSFALALKHVALHADALLSALRQLGRPVIGRIEEDRVLLDLRTVEPGNDAYILDALNALTPLDEPGPSGQS